MGQITKGVPQGSVLGPILFTLYVNDMPNSTKLIPSLFADATSVFNFGHNVPQLIEETKTELHQLDDWLKANVLKLNTAKTNYCVFRSSSSKASANETCNVKMGDILNKSDDTKYLGVILDTQFSWEKQVNKMNPISHGVFFSDFGMGRFSPPSDYLLNYKRHDNETW